MNLFDPPSSLIEIMTERYKIVGDNTLQMIGIGYDN
jgi:hypothetical protein